MRKIVSRDPQYVSEDTCLFKWTEEQSFSPARMRPCGKPDVAGIGLTRAGAIVHLSDPQAVGNLFAWRLAASVEIEETPDGPVANLRNKEEGN